MYRKRQSGCFMRMHCGRGSEYFANLKFFTSRPKSFQGAFYPSNPSTSGSVPRLGADSELRLGLARQRAIAKNTVAAYATLKHTALRWKDRFDT